jgi:NDP-hexose 2,3-enoyl reductase
MDYTNLGRTGLSVSRLCLGTMNFGPQTTEPDSFAIMDRALEHGINFFDTANVYGWQTGEGVTEQIIGRWFAQGGGRRDKVVLATKAYGRMSDWPNDRGLSARHLIQACEGSLRRMQTDWIDLFQMHHVERSTPWEEIWQAMEVLTSQGKIRYAGSSNFAGWHLVQAQEAADRRHFLGLVSAARRGAGRSAAQARRGDSRAGQFRPGGRGAGHPPHRDRGVREAVRRPRP